MKIVKKAAVSLVITLILFTVFTVLSYSTLFDVIESNFYNRKVIFEAEKKLRHIAEGIENYIADRTTILEEVASDRGMKNSFLSNQSRQDILRRENLINSLINKNIGFSFIRVIDPDGKIHFSNNRDDIMNSDLFRITYKMANETTADSFESILKTAEDSKIVFNAEEGHFAFAASVFDNFGIQRGSIYLYLENDDLFRYLSLGNYIEKSIPIFFSGSNEIVFNSTAESEEIAKTVSSYWENDNQKTPYPLYIDSDGVGFFLVALEAAGKNLGYVLTDSVFKIDTEYRYILLFSAFSIIYILTFLLLNIRQDSVTIIADRVKRFQINFLISYLENKNDIEWKKWKKELVARKEEIRKEFKKDLGKIKEEEEKTVNKLIDKSWDEVIGLLAGYLEKTGYSGTQAENIEETLKRIIALMPAAVRPVELSVQQIPAEELSDETVGYLEEVEDVEDVEDLEELEEITLEDERLRTDVKNISFSEKVKIMKEAGQLEITTIEAFDALEASNANADPVIIKDEIPEISNNLYTSPKEVINTELKVPIDDVVEKEETSDVSYLMFDEEIDLPVFADEKFELEAEESVKKEKMIIVDLDFGFNYDYFTINFGKDKALSAVKALLRITDRMNSLFGVILVQNESSYYPEIIVGIDKEYPNFLVINKNEPLYTELLIERKSILFKTKIKEIEELNSKFSPNQSEQMDSLLFFPIKYNEKQAYLVASPQLAKFSYSNLLIKVKNLQK